MATEEAYFFVIRFKFLHKSVLCKRSLSMVTRLKKARSGIFKAVKSIGCTFTGEFRPFSNHKLSHKLSSNEI